MTSEYYFSTYDKDGIEVFLLAEGSVSFGKRASGFDPAEYDGVEDIRVFKTDKRGNKIDELNDSEINDLKIDMEYIENKLWDDACEMNEVDFDEDREN